MFLCRQRYGRQRCVVFSLLSNVVFVSTKRNWKWKKKNLCGVFLEKGLPKHIFVLRIATSMFFLEACVYTIYKVGGHYTSKHTQKNFYLYLRKNIFGIGSYMATTCLFCFLYFYKAEKYRIQQMYSK